MVTKSEPTSILQTRDTFDGGFSNSNLRDYSYIHNHVQGVWRLDLEHPIRLDIPVNEQIELLYRHGYFGEANLALAKLYGFNSVDDIIGFRMKEFLPRDLPTSIPLITRIAEANYTAQNWESVEHDKNGNRKVFLNNCIGEIEQGKLLRVWGSSKDITLQKQFQEKAHLHSAIIEQIPDGCVIVEGRGEKIIYVNSAFTRITGYTALDLPGEKLSFLQGEDTDQGTVESIRKSIANEQTFIGEILNYKKDGTPFWSLMRISPIKDTQGSVSHYVGVITDISEHKRIEAERQRQHNELMHLARVAAMGELTATLAHELNQPLAAILLNAQVALGFLDQDEIDRNGLREIFNDIVADGKRAGKVTHRIRRLVKKEDNKFEPLDINQVVNEVHALVSQDLIMKQIKYSAKLTPKLPLVCGDHVQLQQVLLNLIINASHAMQEQNGGVRLLSISTQKLDSSSVEIIVADSGPGIDEDVLKNIFQPFFTTKKQGMGMGLAINRSIIELHGGRLWVENGSHQGAVFHLTLPIVQ